MATTHYIGDIEVTGPGGRTARDPKHQKALDKYWKKRDRYDNPTNSGSSSIPTSKSGRLATAAKLVMGGKSAFLPFKFKLIAVLFLILAIVLVVVMIYINNAYADEEFISMALDTNANYTRSTSRQVFKQELYNRGILEAQTIKAKEMLNDSSTAVSDEQVAEDLSSLNLPTAGAADSINSSTYTRKVNPSYFPDEGYQAVNNFLLDYCTAQCGEYTVGSYKCDGLLYMAMGNAESYAWARDITKTTSSVFPSKLIRDIDETNYNAYIPNLSFGVLFRIPQAISGYQNLPYMCAWGKDYKTQGFLTQAYYSQYMDAMGLGGAQSEYSQLMEADENGNTVADVINSLYGENALTAITDTCTGGTVSRGGKQDVYYYCKNSSEVATTGDRFKIADSCKAFAYNMSQADNRLYSNGTENVKASDINTKYEAVALARLTHWTPYADSMGEGAGGSWGYTDCGWSNRYDWYGYMYAFEDAHVINLIKGALEKRFAAGDYSCDIKAFNGSTDWSTIDEINSYIMSKYKNPVTGAALGEVTGQARYEFAYAVGHFIGLEMIYSG